MLTRRRRLDPVDEVSLWRPLNGRVFVTPVASPRKAEKPDPVLFGRVLSVADDIKEIHAGDIVAYGTYAGQQVPLDGEPMVVSLMELELYGYSPASTRSKVQTGAHR